MRRSFALVARRKLVLVALVAALFPRIVEASNILEVDRSVTSRVCSFDLVTGQLLSCQTPTVVDPVGFGSFSAALAHASQNSLIAETQLSGTGSVQGSLGGPSELTDSGETTYHIVFQLDSATAYDFSVDNVDTVTNGCFCNSPMEPSGSVTLARVDPSNPGVVLQTIYSVALGRNGSTEIGFPDFSASGVLQPGAYALDYSLRVLGSHLFAPGGSAGFAMTGPFGLMPVPEPGTSLLLAMGVLALTTRRSRSFAHPTSDGAARRR